MSGTTDGACMRSTTDLHADTEAGAAMVAAAEAFAASFTDGALAHDRDGTFAHEHLDALRAGGFLVAPIPADLGGGDVLSIHDVLVACSRLARGDASTAIGVNMHLALVLDLVRQWQVACAREDAAWAKAAADGMRLIVEADVVLAAAVSEPGGQDLTRPATTAVAVDGGWVINGRKMFATMSPAATMLGVSVTYEDADCRERYGFALIPVGTPGMRVHDDWDAIGMRASASGSVSFEDVRLGPDGVSDAFPTREFSVAMHERFLTSGSFHAAASLGIAEGAQARILETLRRNPDGVIADTYAAMRLAENVIDLATMRAVFERSARLLDEYHAAHATGGASLADAQAVFAEVQAAKTHMNEAGSRVVDRALALSGGAGYLAANPLGKAWRDARAGAFMHPLGANRAYDYLARAALGLAPKAA